jgi:hypothetical protein
MFKPVDLPSSQGDAWTMHAGLHFDSEQTEREHGEVILEKKIKTKVEIYALSEPAFGRCSPSFLLFWSPGRQSLPRSLKHVIIIEETLGLGSD